MSGISATSAMLATARSKALFSTPPSGGALELSLSRRPAELSRAAAVDSCIAMCANPAGRAPHTLLHSRTLFCFMVIDPVRTRCFQNTVSAAIAKSAEVSPVRGTRTKAYCDLCRPGGWSAENAQPCNPGCGARCPGTPLPASEDFELNTLPWVLRLLALLYLLLAMHTLYVGSTVIRIPSPFELSRSDLIAAIAGLTGCLIGAWILFEIVLALKELVGS